MARAAVKVLEAYGYAAEQIGRDVITHCPPLLAVSAIQKRVGLADVEQVDLGEGQPPNELGSPEEAIGPYVSAGHMRASRVAAMARAER